MKNKIWHMNCTIYGLQEAMAEFDSHFDAALCGRKADTEDFRMSMRRHTADPAAWSGMSVHMAKYVDDGIAIGTKTDMEDMLSYMGKFFKLKITDALVIGSPENCLEAW